jgi:hypothetical protein
MPRKQAPKSKTPTATSKARSSSSNAARKTPQPESVQRFSGEVICVVGFPRTTEEALGPDLLEKVIAELNKTGIRFVYQDESCVVNLITQLLAFKN